MVIDMNESKLDTIEQIREFLTGTTDVTFCIPADESTLRAFVSTVIRRFGHFTLTKAQRGVLFGRGGEIGHCLLGGRYPEE